MINERPREAEPEPVPTLTEKLANPVVLFMGMMLLYIIEDIVSACVYPMDMLWRLFCVLSLAILPLSTLLLIKMGIDCCGKRCTSSCCKKFHEITERLFFTVIIA
jgi:hypothetical protein